MSSPVRQEIRLALLQCVRRPAFVLGATLSLALGMSLATALYSVMGAVLRPLPYPHASELVSMIETIPEHDMASVPPRLIEAVRMDSRTMRDVVVWKPEFSLVSLGGESRRFSVFSATSNLFPAAGARALLGGMFAGAEGERTAVISPSLWKTEFGGDSSVIGRSIRVGSESYRIGGVVAFGDIFLSDVQIWLPLSEQTLAREAQPANDPGWSGYSAFARLRDGASLAQANAEAAMLYRRVYANDEGRKVRSARAELLADYLMSGVRYQFRLWGAAAFVILLLCAVNFATMSLARGMRRRAELAVRAALGASRLQIVRTLIIEALFFAALAGVVALLMAGALLSFVSGLVLPGALAVPPAIDWQTILFAVVGTVVVGFLFAIAPALELAKVDLRAVMQSGASGTTTASGEMRGQRALVALQLCLALTAVAVVTALVAADRRLVRAGVPFDYTNLILTQAQPLDASLKRIPIDPLIQRLHELPNVESVGGMGTRVTAALLLNHDVDETPPSGLAYVSPDFFRTLGAKPSAGRFPTDDEISGNAPIIVMSHYTAQWGFGSDSAAIGQRVRLKIPGRAAEPVTVIGVVPNLQGGGLYSFFSPVYQIRPLREERGGTIVMRVRGQAAPQVREIARVAASVDPRIMISGTAAADQIVERAIGATRGRTVFLTVVAVLALALAVVGVYGLTSYTTELRARELAIRLALGAHGAGLFRVVSRELWWMAGIAVLVSGLASARLVAFLDSMYRPMSMRSALITMPTGPLAASAITLVVIMAIGVTIPLRRVLRLDVMRTVQGGS